MLQNKKGITLTVLAVTVAVMFIIAGAVIYNGVNDMKKAKENKALSEVQIVNQAVCQAYTNYLKTKNQAYIAGAVVDPSTMEALESELGVNLVTIPSKYDTFISSYYRLTPAELEQIGIYESKDVYIVNYLTGEVINETLKMTETGKPLYTYSINNFNTDVTSF